MYAEKKSVSQWLKAACSLLSRRWLLSISVLLLTGCNSTWFYRPSDKVYQSLDVISNKAPFFLQSSSGNLLHSLFIPAKERSSKTLLVHFHGNAGNITWTSRRYDWLTKYGFDLLVFDYSGYGVSTGEPSPQTTWQDALTILDYSLEQKAAQGWDRVILAGTSLGGNILLHALANHPQKNQFDLVFIDSSFMSYKEVAAGVVSDKPGGYLAAKVARWFISDEFAPVKYAPVQLAAPLVVSHCLDDQLISVDLGRSLYQSIGSPDKLWLPLEGCAHAQGFGDKFFKHRMQLVKALSRPASENN